MAGNVSAFKASFRSNVYRDDLNPTDGVTTWTELDESGVPDGNNNGDARRGARQRRLRHLVLTMRVNGHTQIYRTQVDLRNQSQ